MLEIVVSTLVGAALGGLISAGISYYFARGASQELREVAADLRLSTQDHLDRRFAAAGLNPGQREALLRGPIDREWLVEVVGAEGADTRMGKWIIEESKKPINEKNELAMMWGLTAITKWLEHNAEVAVEDPGAVWIGPPDEGPWFIEVDEEGNEMEPERGFWGYMVEEEKQDDEGR